MKNVIGMQRALPFLKLYDPNEEHGNYIDSRPRYYKEPLQFGDVRVYINSQIYKTDREPFIMWYEALESSFRDAAQQHSEAEKTEVQLIPPLPDKSMKVVSPIDGCPGLLDDAVVILAGMAIRKQLAD